MNKINMKKLTGAYIDNLQVAKDTMPNGSGYLPVASIATLIDYLSGNIDGLLSPLSDIARNDAASSCPPAPKDNGDPNPIGTEVMRRIGELGVQSLSEIKGYKYGDSGNLLLLIKGRFADTGWKRDSPQNTTLVEIMEACGKQFILLK